MATERTVRGGCYCEAVRFRVAGDATWVSYCHCNGCKKLTGAALTVWVCYPSSRVELTGESLAWFEPSDGIRRSFCGRCGTSLTYEDATLPGDTYFCVGSFDDPERFEPESHGNVRELLGWLSFSDDLPRHHLTARPRRGS